MKDRLTIVTNYDDWEGIYFHGILMDQGHRLDLVDVLTLLGYDVDKVEADNDWLLDEGCLPTNLSDCKFSSED
jgi:hypothetical protein